MTTKDLSRELCEICGIETKKIEKRCFECEFNAEECGYRYCYKNAYPDFAKPKNFVKLYKILNKTNEKEFLARLIDRLTYEAGFFTDELKQAIKSEEWVYD